MSAREYNIDGFIGPTHFFGGLGHGNVASEKSAGNVSYPKAAALQGLKKMKLVYGLGIGQMVMPPHPRPSLDFLEALGYTGRLEEKIKAVAEDQVSLLPIIYSSSAMWAANAATLSASKDSADGKIHITPANLISNAHRALEAEFTACVLKQVFKGECFNHHPPLPYNPLTSDEGAANHMRLENDNGDAVHLFVYGAGGHAAPHKYIARQHKQASEAVARKHQLNGDRKFIALQHPDAIDAGVFHNDVIATSNGNLLAYHEMAYENDAPLVEFLNNIGGFKLVKVTSNQLSMQEAVKSYLFNSQILTLPDGSMAIIAPTECEQSQQASTVINGWIQDPANPIAAVHYVDVNQSMSNGGGPACLRLRVWMTDEEAKQVHQGVVFTEALYEQLANAVEQHYPDQLDIEDLKNPALAIRAAGFFKEFAKIVELPNLYDGYLDI